MLISRRFPLFVLVVVLGACGKDHITEVVDSGTPLPTATCLDTDGDGFPGTGDCAALTTPLDCNDMDPGVFPGAHEQCNGKDDNCDGMVDEDLPIVTYYRDEDGDGVGGSVKVGDGCKAPPTGTVTQTGDCNDQNAAVRPGQAELCNGVDDDCDSAIDNGLPFQDFYVDVDGDGFGDANGTPMNSCQAMVSGRVPNKGDCVDSNPTIKPGATELCNKVDDNCDGQIDNGIPFSSYYPDQDGDGFGAAGSSAESACMPVAGKVTNNADCNDASPTVKPGAPELCNAQDDNCDGQVDEGLAFATYYADVDGDGFGSATAAGQSSCQAVAGKVTNNTDCNDTNPTIKPGAAELCNAVDDNCNGAVDDGLTFNQYFVDADGDGFGAGQAQNSCAPVPGRVTNNTDCNDTNPTIKPGATELCNTVDDNCNAQVDEGLTVSSYYPDADGDGYGSSTGSALISCQAIVGRVTNNNDCDDARAAAHPGATETCNGLDDDCVAGIDNGLTFTNYYLDGDGDGHGRATGAVSACSQPAGRVTSNDDCNDSVATTYPGAPELCNGVDDNCDTLVDNGVQTLNYYPDGDGDGFGAAGSTVITSCSVIAGRVTNNTDCNDANAAIKPGATELCNGVDDNCNGSTDEGLTSLSYYPDADNDGFGAASATAQVSCVAVAGKVTDHTDCNDGNAAIKPGATEVCNAVDDNCNGSTDEGLATQLYYTDADSDGFGAIASTGLASCGPVAGRVTNHTDCDDANAAIKPTATEACNNVDDNCNGTVDEGNPGGGAACGTGQLGVCAAGTMTCTAGAVACARNVGPTTEVCNGLDDNCNGTADEGFTGLGVACSAGVGVCLRNGTTVCNAAGTGTTCSVTPGAPTAAACDGLDNNCDGVVDEPVLTSTADVSTTAYTDVEVKPYYYSAAGCAGGVNGTGTDALAGGALVMGGGSSGINFRPLDTAGVPTGANSSFTSLTYSDVDFAQAGDGYVVAGVWASNNAEVDLYYVDSTGAERTRRWTNFKYPVGCVGPPATAPAVPCHTLDSLRVVRGNGRRVTIMWREATYGINMAQVEACPTATGGWEFRAPGCVTTTLTIYNIVASTTAVPGLGADSAQPDWLSSQTCASTATQRRLGVAYQPSATSINFFQVNEDSTGKTADTVAYTVTAASLRTLAEPEVAYFKDALNADQFFVAYVMKDPSATTPQADLDFWMTSDPTWHYAYVAYGTVNGINSISRPRVSASASRIQLSASRYVADATAFKQQVMTRQTDLAGARVPLGTAVELSVTSGACGADPACRPGNKAGFTNWLPFNHLYFSGTGSTPVGSYASVLTCN
jgi:hypothetical protein